MSARQKFLGVFFASSIFCAGVLADSDFEYRNEEAIEVGLTDRLSAGIEVDFRFNDDASKHYYTSADLELVYEFLEWLEGGAGYKHKYGLKEGEWKDENRPYILGAIKWKWADWKLKNRAKLEYRMKQDQDEYFRFRNKLTVKSPWKWTQLEINPYVADEIFIDEKDDFNKNRAYAGAGLKLFEHVYLDIYYFLEVEKENGDWDQYVNAIGTELKLKF